MFNPSPRTNGPNTGTGGQGTTARWYADGGSRGGNPCPPLDLRSASPSTPRTSREARLRRSRGRSPPAQSRCRPSMTSTTLSASSASPPTPPPARPSRIWRPPNEQPMQTPQLRPLARGRGLLRHAPLRGTPPRTLHRGPQQPHQGQAAQARPQAPAEREHRQPRPVPPHHRQAQRPLTSPSICPHLPPNGDNMTEVAVAAMTRDQAERLTERARLVATTLMEAREKLASILTEANEGRVWEALDMPNIQAWTEFAFSTTPLAQLSREDRRVIVKELAAEGYGTRAIAPIVGKSHMSVARDLASVTDVTDEAPAPREVHGRDGITRT